MSADLDEATASTIRLTEAIANMADALARLSTTADRLDEEIGQWMESASDSRPPTELIQDVDLLRQSIDCFAALTANLAQQPLPPVSLSKSELASGLYLGELREACLGTGATEERQTPVPFEAATAS